MRDRPELAAWWKAREAETHATFRKDRTFVALERLARQPRLPHVDDLAAEECNLDDQQDCFCG